MRQGQARLMTRPMRERRAARLPQPRPLVGEGPLQGLGGLGAGGDQDQDVIVARSGTDPAPACEVTAGQFGAGGGGELGLGSQIGGVRGDGGGLVVLDTAPTARPDPVAVGVAAGGQTRCSAPDIDGPGRYASVVQIALDPDAPRRVDAVGAIRHRRSNRPLGNIGTKSGAKDPRLVDLGVEAPPGGGPARR